MEKKFKALKFVFFAEVCLFSFSLNGCNGRKTSDLSSENEHPLQNMNDKLQTEIRGLKETNTKLQTEIRELKDTNAKLQTEIQELKTQVEAEKTNRKEVEQKSQRWILVLGLSIVIGFGVGVVIGNNAVKSYMKQNKGKSKKKDLNEHE